MLKKSLQEKTLISLDVYECTWPNSTTQGVLSHCKGGQLRWKEPSPFSFTLSSSENSPEFRTTLQDSTGNYHKTEVHYQRFCFEDQRGKYRQTNTNWKDDINVLLSLVKMLLENTYFSCLLSVYPSILSLFQFQVKMKHTARWVGGKTVLSLGCLRTDILDSLKLNRNVWCVKEVIENKYYTYLKLQTTSHC